VVAIVKLYRIRLEISVRLIMIVKLIMQSFHNDIRTTKIGYRDSL
jgi:hypothetical protein